MNKPFKYIQTIYLIRVDKESSSENPADFYLAGHLSFSDLCPSKLANSFPASNSLQDVSCCLEFHFRNQALRTLKPLGSLSTPSENVNATKGGFCLEMIWQQHGCPIGKCISLLRLL